jgi:hypothetical protein
MQTICCPTTKTNACLSCLTGRSWGWESLPSVLAITGGGITRAGLFIGNAMFGYAGRHRRDGRRTGVRGRLTIGHGRNLVGRRMVEGFGLNRDGRITVGDFGPSRGVLTMVEGLGLSLGDRITARGPDRSRVGRVTVGEFGLGRVDLTMVGARGHNPGVLTMARGLDRSRVVPVMVGEFGQGRGGQTMVGARGLNLGVLTMARGLDLSPVGPMVGRDRSLRGLTTGRGLRPGGLVVGARASRRRPISRARRLLDRLRLIGVLKRLRGVISGRSRSECVAAHR